VSLAKIRTLNFVKIETLIRFERVLKNVVSIITTGVVSPRDCDAQNIFAYESNADLIDRTRRANIY